MFVRCIHIVWNYTLFLLLKYSIVWLCHALPFYCWCTLDYFQFWALKNNASKNTPVYVFNAHVQSFLLDLYVGVKSGPKVCHQYKMPSFPKWFYQTLSAVYESYFFFIFLPSTYCQSFKILAIFEGFNLCLYWLSVILSTST